MKKILHYVGKMNRGGMEALIMNIYRNIDRSICQFDFAIHGNENGDYEDEIIQLGGHFFQFPHMRSNPIKYRKTWRKFWQLHKNEYYAFHCHTNSLANAIALEEATRANVPIRIVHSHSSSANKGKLQLLNNWLHHFNQKRLPKLATNYIACSDKAATWLFGGMEVEGEKVEILNNGIDAQCYKYNAAYRNEIRNEFGIVDKIVVGHIGAFLPVKNHEFLLKVISELRKLNNNIVALLIGDGPQRERIKEIIVSDNLEEFVILAGKRGDVNKLLSSMDIYVMPSLYEGLPVSLVEVQANGLPAVISDTITKDVLIKDNMIYMSLKCSPREWAEKIMQIVCENLRDDDILPIIEKGFDIKDTVMKYMQILKLSNE